ncbi:DNA cytosine methyltransferase [Scatolibacter rhodanostii]|uniref:DNA cytosine methyltransferase n=1 Tax=Scatolibacter rhodanostii TaxID=2014781 RepID=UPI000C082058|nr:DNA cytosine methyltransferase [Scatolibacter rhodanostii]
MKILIACEESQAVCTEMRKLGHEAYSCDIEPCSGGHPEWHIQADVLPLLNGNCEFKTVDGMVHKIVGKWDMLIAFPPCTYLSNVGAPHLFAGGGKIKNQERYEKGLQAKEFFMQFYNADCDKIAIENPTPMRIWNLPNKSQVVQPWQFGHEVQKRTQLSS